MLQVLVAFLSLASFAFGADTDSVYRVGSGVSSPAVLHKVDPAYTPEAERERVQGTALYSIVIDKSGRARDIELMSPIGYGLDEKGVEAIQKWVFKPAEKEGKPVNVRAALEVNFRFPGLFFDSKAEDHRTAYNEAIHNFSVSERKVKAVESINKLARESYPPAMSVLGQWMIEGKEVSQDVSGGMGLLKRASEKYDKHALYVLGVFNIEGQHMPADREKGLKLLRDASMHGSPAAQLYLGSHYANGDTLSPPDQDRARYYFRLCAARGNARCQFELGKLLSQAPGENKGDPVQALAWLELAHEGSMKDADPLLLKLRETLTEGEAKRAEKLKTQLVRR